MENIHLENIDFEYAPGCRIFSGATVDINQGELVLLCGKTGCGKSTLLRLIQKELDTKAGFVMQNPDNQIVCDKVYAELEFGAANAVQGNERHRLEIIRQRVAETAGYFGISRQIDRDTHTLSGGEKQILNIASAMAANPKVLLLDEPTSMLDPIMADRVIDLVKNINREMGITVIIAEHRSDRIFAYADKILLIEDKTVVCKDKSSMAEYMSRSQELRGFLPEIARSVEMSPPPLSLAEAVFGKAHAVYGGEEAPLSSHPVLRFKNVSFAYDRSNGALIDNLNLSVDGGSITALLGENGCGKSTLALLSAGALKPYSGSVKINGRKIKKAGENSAMLFQDVTVHFTGDTVDGKYNGMHPYDLSGGERQLAALDIILSKNPSLLILDEPTKGLDYNEKEKLGKRLEKIRNEGKAILLITHDVEFAAMISDRMLLMFGGKIVCDRPAREFCESNIFYTTAGARLSIMNSD